MWATPVACEFDLSQDQIDYLASILDLQTWPSVLAVGPRHEFVYQREKAWAVAASNLYAAGLLTDDPDPAVGVSVTEAVAEALAILSRPDVFLEIRCHHDTSTRRMCLARRGDHHVLASSTESGLLFRDIPIGTDADVGQLVARLLDPSDAAQVSQVSVSADELQRRLDGAQSAADYSDALHAMGVAAADAATYAVAFDTCCGHTEIVAIECAAGRMRRSAGAVAVYDTARGRIVAGPSMSPDGQIWSTLSPGTGYRISQAVSLLMETLPARRWLP